MAYLTDRKRATGLGSAKSGVHHHWTMIVTSVLLLVLVPLFVLTFGRMYGAPYEVMIAYMARPWPAVITGLTLAVGFYHFAMGARAAIEDYSHGLARQIGIIALNLVCLALAGYGLFALARLAF